MNYYDEELKNVVRECSENFEIAEDNDSDDQEYKAIREKALELLGRALHDLEENEYGAFKKSVFEFLCANCGCHLDYEVLKEYTPKVLSYSDFEYIVKNSSLARFL